MPVPMTPEDVDRLCRQPSEHERLEFKEAKIQIDEPSLQKYCVALANEGGGHLLLGVTDKPPRRVVGSKALADPAGMVARLFQALGFRVDIEAIPHPDGRVVIVRIPSRPRGTAYAYKGQYLMRTGEALVPMSEDRLRAIFDEGKPDWLASAARQGVSPADIVELLDTQTYFELSHLPYPESRDAVVDRLERERLINRANSGYEISNLGAILLAKRLGDFDGIGRKAPRVIVYEGGSKLQTKTRADWRQGICGWVRRAGGFHRVTDPSERGH
ncbi:MAG: helix-turn-helix domain-containing protein [Gemmatimonadales bacterium]